MLEGLLFLASTAQWKQVEGEANNPQHNSRRLVKEKHVALRGACKLGGAVPTLQKRKLRLRGGSTSAQVSPPVGPKAGIQTQVWLFYSSLCYSG